MNVKKQKIIRFIPIVQLLTMFFWIKSYMTNNLKYLDFFKAFFRAFLVVFLVNLPRMIIHLIFVDNVALNNILYYVSIYPTFLGMSFVFVADQEKHLL